MTIDPQAVEAFLARPQPTLPQFKGADKTTLERLIYDSTGLPFEEVTVSRHHQLEGTAFALYQRRALLYFWMRLGKSKCALDWATHLKRANLTQGKGLIVAHAPIGTEVWKGQAAQHSTLRLRAVQSGPTSSDDFVDALQSDCDLVVIAHSTLQQLFSVKKLSRKGKPKLYPDYETLRMAAGCFTHVIIDEIDLCSNALSLRVQICSMLVSQCKHR